MRKLVLALALAAGTMPQAIASVSIFVQFSPYQVPYQHPGTPRYPRHNQYNPYGYNQGYYHPPQQHWQQPRQCVRYVWAPTHNQWGQLVAWQQVPQVYPC
jgi:hypothetical protein